MTHFRKPNHFVLAEDDIAKIERHLDRRKLFTTPSLRGLRDSEMHPWRSLELKGVRCLFRPQIRFYIFLYRFCARLAEKEETPVYVCIEAEFYLSPIKFSGFINAKWVACFADQYGMLCSIHAMLYAV